MADLKNGKITTDRADLKSHYSVVVVGSGYGGAVAAARLARTGESVCLLERGDEFHPGDFPQTQEQLQKETQLTKTHEEADAEHVGSRAGLFDFHIDYDISVLRGCGLGGTSLISAGVSLQPDAEIFQQPCWPKGFQEDLEDGVADGFSQARAMLQPNEYPEDAPPLKKMAAMQRSAAVLEKPFLRLPIHTAFEARENASGVELEACSLCGNCLTGCNSGASNHVAMNYLPDASQHGAEIFTRMEARRVGRTFDGRQWRVYYWPLDEQSDGAETAIYDDADEAFITADCVVLSAGSIGTTEILLRSKNHGLVLSDQLGKSFSGNANLIGFAYNGDERVNAVGNQAAADRGENAVGPAIACAIDVRADEAWQDQYMIEDAAMPEALSNQYAAIFSSAEPLIRNTSGTKGKDFLKEKWRKAESVLRGAHFGAVANTQVFHLTGHDSAVGKIKLDNDQLQLEWSGVSAETVFEKFDSTLSQLSEASGGTYISNPEWSEHLNSRLVTTQPLGGCAMAEDATEGVTNHRGQVFQNKKGTNIHVGLYVADGALLPMSLGVSPLLTITALAERNMVLLAAEYGWDIAATSAMTKDAVEAEADAADSVLEEALPILAPPILAPPILKTAEAFSGFWSPESGEYSDFEVAFRAGKDSEQKFDMTIQIQGADDARHSGAVFGGEANVPVLSESSLDITQGTLHLSEDESGDFKEVYQAILSSKSGEKWQFNGYCLEHHNSAEQDLEAETLESDKDGLLYFSVRLLDGHDKEKSNDFLGKGILLFQLEFD